MQCNYGVRFDGPYGVDYMMDGLAKEVEKRMAAAEIRGSKITLKIMKSKDATKVPGKFLGHGSCHSLSKCSDIELTRDKIILASAGMKLLKMLNVDIHLIRGMGLVVTSLKFDGDTEAQSSSPLSTWLKKNKSVSNSQSMNDVRTQTKNDRRDEAVANSKLVTFFEEEDGEEETFESSPRRSESLMPNTFSQIDQDVLQNLPDEILDELKSEYTKSKPASRQSPKRTLQKKVAVNKQIPIEGQVSVKRMFKLNSIKSGVESFEQSGTNCTLSQLDCLPLEVQLQIANCDNTTIAKRASRNAVARSTLRTSSVDMPSDPSDAINSSFYDQDCTHEEIHQEPPCNFFRDNIVPLKDFILSNPDPSTEVVGTVGEFLNVCVSEKRIHDVVVFLRAIRNLPNGWNDALYRELRDSADDEIYAVTGDRLDLPWLGL